MVLTLKGERHLVAHLAIPVAQPAGSHARCPGAPAGTEGPRYNPRCPRRLKEPHRMREGGMNPKGGRQRPVLLVVDDDPAALGAISRELDVRYGRDYHVVGEDSVAGAERTLRTLRETGEEVALVLADHRLAETSGAELLTLSHQLLPLAKRALLVPWGAWRDRATAAAILRAVAQGQADSYLLKPWDSPDELFHEAITGFLYDWARAHPARPEVRVVGERWAPRSHELRDLLQRSAVSYAFLEADSAEGQALLAEVGRSAAYLPVVVLLDGQTLVAPSNAELAAALVGVDEGQDTAEPATFDVIIVGAGPAGLAAAVNAASEGLSTLVVDREGIGGQVSSSSLIRNYVGFPRGVTGSKDGGPSRHLSAIRQGHDLPLHVSGYGAAPRRVTGGLSPLAWHRGDGTGRHPCSRSL